MESALVPIDPPRSTPVGERILAAAATLFYERGVTATGVDLVVERAGSTKRTLYQRFGSKDTLVAAYLQQRAHRWQRQLLDALAGVTAQQRLDVVYDQAQQWAADNLRGCAFVNAWAELGPGDSEAIAVIQAEKRWMRALFTEVAGGDEGLGAALHLLYEGAQVNATIEEDPAAFTVARRASAGLLAAGGRG